MEFQNILYLCGFLAILLYIFRKLFIERQFGVLDPQDEESVQDKVVLITGANIGLGRQTSLEMCKRGAKVIMASRDMDQARYAIKYIRDRTSCGDLIALKLDLASYESIKKFTQNVRKKVKVIDILVNNAGVLLTPKSQGVRTEESIELHFGVNYLGHFLLTNLLLDLIKKSTNGRIVNLSSIGHKKGVLKEMDNWTEGHPENKIRSYMGIDININYCNSKLAIVMFSQELSKRLTGSNVNTYCLCPGIVDTNITRDFRLTMNSIHFYITNGISKLFFKTPEQGSRAILFCALSKKCSNQSGLLYRHASLWTETGFIIPEDFVFDGDLPKFQDVDLEKLWTMSERLVGLQLDNKEKSDKVEDKNNHFLLS